MSEPTSRILVVDDDDAFRNFTARILASSGYVVAEAQDGAIGIDKLGRFKPDLMLLDLCMPRVDGWGVLEHVRTLAAPPHVLVVSGVREVVPPGDLGRCITGYVFKPFRVGQLVQACEGVLARPAVTAGGGHRQDARRTFIADATVFDDNGRPIGQGLLVEVSARGLRLELKTELEPGRPVKVFFRVPGHPQAIEVSGVVRWSDAMRAGAEVSTLSEVDDAVLRALVDLD